MIRVFRWNRCQRHSRPFLTNNSLALLLFRGVPASPANAFHSTMWTPRREQCKFWTLSYMSIVYSYTCFQILCKANWCSAFISSRSMFRPTRWIPQAKVLINERCRCQSKQFTPRSAITQLRVSKCWLIVESLCLRFASLPIVSHSSDNVKCFIELDMAMLRSSLRSLRNFYAYLFLPICVIFHSFDVCSVPPFDDWKFWLKDTIKVQTSFNKKTWYLAPAGLEQRILYLQGIQNRKSWVRSRCELAWLCSPRGCAEVEECHFGQGHACLSSSWSDWQRTFQCRFHLCLWTHGSMGVPDDQYRGYHAGALALFVLAALC